MATCVGMETHFDTVGWAWADWTVDCIAGIHRLEAGKGVVTRRCRLEQTKVCLNRHAHTAATKLLTSHAPAVVRTCQLVDVVPKHEVMDRGTSSQASLVAGHRSQVASRKSLRLAAPCPPNIEGRPGRTATPDDPADSPACSRGTIVTLAQCTFDSPPRAV